MDSRQNIEIQPRTASVERLEHEPPMVPFKRFNLKVHSRCDLDCAGCYVFNQADTAWGRQANRFMPLNIVEKTVARVKEHAMTHELAAEELHFILHGGEPTLLGVEKMRATLEAIHDEGLGLPEATISMQTNGLGLSREMLDTLQLHGVRIGVSLDGDRWGNRHRVYRDGRESFDQVVEAITMLNSEYPEMYGGILWTLPYFLDGEEIPGAEELCEKVLAGYENIIDLNPPRLDILLPHANHQNPPHDVDAYGKMLITLFNRWLCGSDTKPSDTRRVDVRLFKSAIRLHSGMSSLSEVMGMAPITHATIDPSGAMMLSDDLKSAYEGADETGGLSVLTDGFDKLLRHPRIVERQIGMAALSEVCQACDIVKLCGGGLYAHRYRPSPSKEDEFRNPSVYSDAHRAFLDHVGKMVAKNRRPT